jgi:hypothetical protein
MVDVLPFIIEEKDIKFVQARKNQTMDYTL